jgi:hypothetical protein
VINYRFQGVAEKKPETQETVLVKRIKLGVRFIKDSGGVYVRKVGLMSPALWAARGSGEVWNGERR